uniref:Uncharacterized protein n=1 Tax=Octopus bimaculoides TaxID=37653 RepID=A0A0L8G389_OCTBM
MSKHLMSLSSTNVKKYREVNILTQCQNIIVKSLPSANVNTFSSHCSQLMSKCCHYLQLSL